MAELRVIASAVHSRSRHSSDSLCFWFFSRFLEAFDQVKRFTRLTPQFVLKKAVLFPDSRLSWTDIYLHVEYWHLMELCKCLNFLQGSWKELSKHEGAVSRCLPFHFCLLSRKECEKSRICVIYSTTSISAGSIPKKETIFFWFSNEI